MRFLIVLLCVCAGCVATLPADATLDADIGCEAARAIVASRKAPAPDPGPKPGDTCPNCKGKGYVGDGTVKTKCLPCDGTGKVLKSVLVRPDCADGSCAL